MRVTRVMLATLASALTMALATTPELLLAREEAAGFDYCRQWTSGGTSWHNFGFFGSCYDGSHMSEIPGRCNVHQNYPCFYCTLGC